MSIDHNRIKVADLEQNEPNKILTTNDNGELEFTDINDIKIDSYNALDYTGNDKALDARQGKILQDTKVDKVVGERLINAAEITKLSGLSNIVTTVKSIPSTVLATQNVAGFVNYINALNPNLIIGANEIVKYIITDTGRSFELNVRGRSFGIGQLAISATAVTEVTEFLNKDIKLSNYPSTRNDGQLPTNKVLSTDANGNLKLYSLPAFTNYPSPFLEEVLSSILPNTTGNLTMKGSFFTPNMSASITGQTVNYITFINDNLIKINITTGSLEGTFAITLNNGGSATFNNAVLVFWGTVLRPVTSDWINLIQPIDVSETGSLKVLQYSILGSAVLNKNKISIKSSINFRFVFNFENTPFEQYPSVADFSTKITFYRVNDNVPVYSFELYLAGGSFNGLPNQYGALQIRSGENLTTLIQRDISNNSIKTWNQEIRLQRVGGVVSLFRGGSLMLVFAYIENTEMYVKFETKKVDFLNIKYIELAT